MAIDPAGIRSVVLDSPFPPNADTPLDEALKATAEAAEAGMEATKDMVATIGKAKALDMILFSKRVTPQEARECGLVKREGPDGGPGLRRGATALTLPDTAATLPTRCHRLLPAPSRLWVF